MGYVVEQDSTIVLPTTAGKADIENAFENFDTVLLEPGTYTFGASETLTIPIGKTLAGYSEAGFTTVILDSSLTAGSFLKLNEKSSLKNLIVEGVNASGGAHGVEYIGLTTASNSCYLERVISRNWPDRGFTNMIADFIRCQAVSNVGHGFHITGIPALWFFHKNLSRLNGADGVHCDFTGLAFVSDMYITDCKIILNGAQGFRLNNTGGTNTMANVFVSRCGFFSNNSNGLNILSENLFRIFVRDCVSISSVTNQGIRILANVNGEMIHVGNCDTDGNSGNGLAVSSSGTLRYAHIYGCGSRFNGGRGITVVPATVNQCRVTGCHTRGNTGDGINVGGAREGGLAAARSQIVGNISRGNTGVNLSIGAEWLSADNV